MTNAEAIEILRANYPDACFEQLREAVDKALKALKESQRTGRWIPCSERLPEAEVLCCDIRGEMIIGYPYQDDESNTGYSAVSDDVYMIDCIAWMPLPEPYREGGT